MPESKIQCKLVESSIIVFNHDDATFLYTGGRYFGRPIGVRKPKPDVFYDKPLELSLIEGLYLLNKEKIDIQDSNLQEGVSKEHIVDIGEKYYENFLSKYEIYEDLRDKGYIVRPGLKFGADFAVYKKGPGLDHSPYLIQVLPKHSNLTAIDIVRAGRLANSVKKKFIIANALNRTYYGFKWFRP
jgi:tRNA-intron endonuclease